MGNCWGPVPSAYRTSSAVKAKVFTLFLCDITRVIVIWKNTNSLRTLHRPTLCRQLIISCHLNSKDHFPTDKTRVTLLYQINKKEPLFKMHRWWNFIMQKTSPNGTGLSIWENNFWVGRQRKRLFLD